MGHQRDTPGFAVRPLYRRLIYAYSAGVNIPLGVVDREAPVVQLEYPETPWGAYYLSPNADGKNDELDLPLTIKERRYLTGYTMTVYRGDAPPAEAASGTASEASPDAAEGSAAAAPGEGEAPAPKDGQAVRSHRNKESRPDTAGWRASGTG
jgi:hypothetical protein